jgi:hypothetical protein
VVVSESSLGKGGCIKPLLKNVLPLHKGSMLLKNSAMCFAFDPFPGSGIAAGARSQSDTARVTGLTVLFDLAAASRQHSDS